MKSFPNIYLIGPMGVGKTTIGRYLAKELNLSFYDSDQEIESRTGVTVDWIFDVEGEEGFRERERHLIEELTQLDGIVLSTGGGTVHDDVNRLCLSKRGVVIYLYATVEQQLTRTSRAATGRPLLNEGDPRAILTDLHQRLDPLFMEIADHTFDTDGRSVKSVAEQIIELMISPVS